MDKICGNCEYNQYDTEADDYVCACEDSEAYGISTFYEDTCDNFEERDDY